MTVKLTHPLYLEGVRFEEGTELVISSDGENEVLHDTPHEPENQIDLGLVADEEKADEKIASLPLEETDEEQN